jgi:hypothetical protein
MRKLVSVSLGLLLLFQVTLGQAQVSGWFKSLLSSPASPMYRLVPEEYTRWKELTRAMWRSHGVTAPIAQVADLVNTLNNNLSELSREPTGNPALYYQQEALFAYNFLRELAGQEPVVLFGDIDISWVKAQEDTLGTQETYQAWKKQAYIS